MHVDAGPETLLSQEITILTVDDSEATRYAIARTLQTEGFQVLQAATGAEALHLLNVQKPDLILLDVKLPDISGLEVCRQIKSDAATSSIPVLHLSANCTTTRSKVAGLDGGADGYLTQPIDSAELIAAVKAFLRNYLQEKKLRQHQEELEKRVKERTAQLAETNAILKQQIATSEASRQELEQTKAALQTAYSELEHRVAERTAQLLQANKALRQEVQDRKQVEAALRTSQAKIQSLIESNIIGILFGNVDGQIVDANDEFLRTIGYSRADLRSGKLRWTDLTPPEYAHLDEYGIAEAKIKGGCTPYEKEYLRQDGTRIPVLVGYVLVGQERSESVAFILDLTERKRIEAERAQLLEREQIARQKAEEVNRMKDEFIATVSHELRTPLNAILGWSQLLQKRQLDPAAVARGLEIVERNAKSQAQLVEDLLEVSRLIRGKVRLIVRPIELANVIRAAMNTVVLAAEVKHIKLEFGSECSASVSGDSDRLQQVVWNLLSNAIKFTPEGGRVEVRLSVASDKQSPYVEIAVSDTGQGICPQFLPYVFDRFRQADSSTTRSQGGLGLGLAIVRQLVELHGGSVFADSPGLGKGTTFTVRLPLVSVENQLKPPKITATLPTALTVDEFPSLNGLRVLVADDEADAREFVEAVLTQCGASVTMAASVTEAIAAFKNSQPDILVSDIGMPEEDGYELLRQVRELETGREIPAIALTAYSRVEDRIRILAAGFQLHVPKPVEPQELAFAIANLTDRKIGKSHSTSSTEVWRRN
jgi:PAS domain S-box-containing protein